jgi:hypothetical protein
MDFCHTLLKPKNWKLSPSLSNWKDLKCCLLEQCWSIEYKSELPLTFLAVTAGRRSDSQIDIPNVTYRNENSDENDEENINEFSNFAYVTKQDLLTGLDHVGNSFGKDNRII